MGSGALALSLGKDFAEHLFAPGRHIPVQDILVADPCFDDAEVLEHGQAVADQITAEACLVGQADEVAVNVVLFGDRAQDLDIVVRKGFLGRLRLDSLLRDDRRILTRMTAGAEASRFCWR